MTVRVERTFEIEGTPEEVWAFIADPAKRARSISVVERYEETGEHTARWHVRLPIPLVKRTIAVDTEEITREEPWYVEFVGDSKAMSVRGEHELEPSDAGTKLLNRFVVDGKLPGVERFFEARLDDEFENLRIAIEAALEE